MKEIYKMLYTTHPEHNRLTDLKHTRYYRAQAKTKEDYSLDGYEVIRLDEDIDIWVGWHKNEMRKTTAKKGDYLIQTSYNPPDIITSWPELRKKYRVFKTNYKDPYPAQ